MKISLNWLKDYIDLNGISVDEIASKLTMSGLEVEDMYDEGAKYKNFIVASVKEKIKHPNADKLSICTVYTGKEDLQVICGAPNVDAGQKVVFAPIGTVIPNGNFTITKAKIRGVESFGMICAEDELELSSDHSGIMVLDNKLVEGTPVADALNLNDVVFEIGITPNRPDALSHIGVARDLAALFNKKLYYPEIQINEVDEDINKSAAVEIEDLVNCPRFSAKVIKDVKLKESPEWMKNRLTKIGLRPINNIVDVTNYVMYELGQPLHSYDLNRIKGNKIIVRSTKGDTEFVTLDSKSRKLPDNSLMICDAEKPVGIAGIMGGENSEIYDDTKDVLIESAYFNPSSIRRTSKLTGLSTEASYRFERGCDYEKTDYAALRAAQLIAELGEGKVQKGAIDIYPSKIEEKIVSLRVERVEKILGYKVSKEQIVDILNKLEIKVIKEEDNKVFVRVPGFRPDIEREIDLIEEIARIYGYDNIPAISKISVTLSKKVDEANFSDNAKDTAAALGFFEMLNNPLQSEKAVSIDGNKIAILNPQSADMGYLRTTLISGALMTAARNINVGEKNLRLFEIGSVFNKKTDGEIKSFDDFDEKKKLLFLLTGKETAKGWNSEEKEFDYYTLKKYIDSWLEKMFKGVEFEDVYSDIGNSLYDFYFAKSKNNDILGTGGKLKKEIARMFDIQQDIYCFEFDVELLKSIKPETRKFIELLKYPKVFKDFAFIFDKKISYKEIIEFITKQKSSILKSAEIFDIFENASLGENNRSIAIQLEYYSTERTLKEEEVEKDFNKLISKISKQFDAKLRGI